MDDSHILAGCRAVMRLLSSTSPPWLTGPRPVSDGWASAQPPHTSVGLSLGGPPPFVWTYYVRSAAGCSQWLSPGYHGGSERVRSWFIDVGAHLARAKTALTCSSLTGSPVNVCRRAGTANKQVLGIEAESEPVGEVGSRAR